MYFQDFYGIILCFSSNVVAFSYFFTTCPAAAGATKSSTHRTTGGDSKREERAPSQLEDLLPFAAAGELSAWCWL